MNAQKLAVLIAIVFVPAASGCGSVRNLLFGDGARCGACAANGPRFNIAPPAYGGPAVPSAGCGTPGCGAVQGGECGCGGEYGGAYYGGYDPAHPGTIIGAPTVGNGIYGGRTIDDYNTNNWIPADPNYVPGTIRMSDEAPVTPMLPVPQGT